MKPFMILVFIPGYPVLCPHETLHDFGFYPKIPGTLSSWNPSWFWYLSQDTRYSVLMKPFMILVFIPGTLSSWNPSWFWFLSQDTRYSILMKPFMILVFIPGYPVLCPHETLHDFGFYPRFSVLIKPFMILVFIPADTVLSPLSSLHKSPIIGSKPVQGFTYLVYSHSMQIYSYNPV